MKQRADGGLLRLRQKSPDVHGQAEMSFTMAALNPNQTSTLVLPLVSDSKRLMWIRSNQMNLQLDGATELEKAFDKFPYLKRNQAATLAQRCSLHPDQVRVWFMVQRLRYGVSWDYEDILKVRRRLEGSRGKEKLQKGTGGSKTLKREAKESGGIKAGEVSEEQSANKGRMMAANVKSERKIVQEQPAMEEKYSTQKKRKMMAAKDKVAKKSRADVAVTERVKRESSRANQPDTTVFTSMKKKAEANIGLPSSQVWPDHKCFLVQDETPDVLPSLIPLTQTPKTPRTPVMSGFERKAEMEGEPHTASKNPNIANVGEPTVPMNAPNNPVVADGYPRSHFYTKTQSQLKMMKRFFSSCQYPDSEDYDRLAALISLPRPRLVQWFADMRYYVKKLKPTWLTPEQHKQALANISYRQCLSTLARALERERREGRGEQPSVQVPPEDN
ncbi:homeobox and leucine zipper encoding b [Acanthopagrus latus]|uniref:homeobox and leucine zipper encoding b n=1 Tax=Acanthopagrus latus TaxID=8177 RepID=UPI00187D0769|nr:homeobox and leucine zipper encoding b [Acanthopagrus latus]XP_036968256.1 homeobox and leucine zipper encoding b [Acanthopagrus latus]